MSMIRLWSSKRGTSLVEVLVVMVVLLVGIMTIIQLFPTGFRVVKAAESQTIATKLGEGEIERWKNMLANLPAGILPIDENGIALNDQYPGPPFESWENIGADDAPVWVRRNVLNIRQVIGETTSIPVGSYFQTGGGTQYGSQYTLAFSPIDVRQDPGTGEIIGLEIKSGDLRRRRGDKDFYPPYIRAGEFAIDHGEQDTPTFYVAFQKNSSADERKYYISYSYWAVDPGDELVLLSKLNERVIAPPGYDGDWISVPVTEIPAGYTFVEMEPDSDACARAFTENTAGSWDPDNPYEFVLADSVLGVIAFNPTGNGKMEYTARGLRPIEARIDYRVLDLRILHQDRVISQPAYSGATEIPVKLPLRFILANGDPTDDPNEPVFNGMAPNSGIPEDVLVLDLATGLRVGVPNPGDAGRGMAIDTIDYTGGVVNLPVRACLMDWQAEIKADNVPLAGRHLRFFYRADGDWTVQCHKAYAVYSRDWGSGNMSPDYRHYKLQAPGGPGDKYQLLFAQCEAGKTVSVDYEYSLTYSSGGKSITTSRKVVGESCRISNETNAHGQCYAELAMPVDPDIARNLKGEAKLVMKRIYAVTGVSFKARVIWRDGKNWRYVDVDSNLVRS